jgi:hypothetical protein
MGKKSEERWGRQTHEAQRENGAQDRLSPGKCMQHAPQKPRPIWPDFARQFRLF